jgi:metallo-beta-lactamase family protein
MDLRFLGAATTVTGSQFLLTTEQACVLIDCGMFQGSPNESIRNRIPLAYDPAKLDGILLTHAHLDHCGLIPHVVKEGFSGPIWATKGTVELAGLVLLDSGKLQEEFAKRGARRDLRDPQRAASDDRRDVAAYEAAVELADKGDEAGGVGGAADRDRRPSAGQSSGSWAGPERRIAGVPNRDVSNFGRRRDDAALMVPGRPGAASTVTVAANPEAALLAQPPSLEVDLDEPLYDERDARRALERFRGIDYAVEYEVAPGIHATFVDAGHILGSAIISLRVADRVGGPERRIVFSGDLGRSDTPILRDPTTLTDADYVLVESTYGGREHEPEAESIRILEETVRLVAEHDGVLLVPSFAVGRTQEVVWELERLIAEGKIPLLPLYLDSPMASKASAIYRAHPDYYDTETRDLLARHESPLDYSNQIVTNDVRDSQAIARAKRPYMIVASNGMLTGGRVVGHLRNLIDDPSAVILFVGYQGVGTLGDHLQTGAKTVKIDGQVRQVRCQIRSISGFSAHADESELLDWIRHFSDGKKLGDPGFPRRVFLVHGDPDAQAALLPKVRALGFDAVIPAWHERVELD